MDMRCLLLIFMIIYLITLTVAAPVDKSKPAESENEIKENVIEIDEDKKVDDAIDGLKLEYDRYLQEVVKTLEEDSDFQNKIKNATYDQVMSGHLARHVETLDPHIRSRLDELKRIELDRLRKLAMKEHKLEEEIANEQHDNNIAGHLDHSNPHTFEVEDLQKLIVKVSQDLEELDRKRRRDFKQYEMEKEIQYRHSLQNMTAEQRTEAEKKHDETKKKHLEHQKVHHPGSKQQFEQVWEEQDHMPKQDFDPKIFFQLHDINGDGFLDQEEVESMLSIEVRKLYNENDPSYDKNEMMEEYHRMRESIYQQVDANKDGLISQPEFLNFIKNPNFEKDDGWKGIEEAPVYSEEELKRYEHERQQQRLAEHYENYGAYYIPHHPDMQQQGYGQQHQQQPMYYQAHPGQQVQYVVNAPPQHIQAPVQYHHVELPQQNYGQMPPNQGYHPNQPQQGYNPNVAALPPAQHQQQPQQHQQQQQHYQQGPPPQQKPSNQPINYGISQNQQQHPPPPPPSQQYNQQAPPPQMQYHPQQAYQQQPPPQQAYQQQQPQHQNYQQQHQQQQQQNAYNAPPVPQAQQQQHQQAPGQVQGQHPPPPQPQQYKH